MGERIITTMTATITDLADFRLTRLDPEPWGARLTRAREGAGFTLRDLDGLDLPFGRGVVFRLEQLHHVPADMKSRRYAFMLLVLYGYDPAEFDLGPDDVPPFIDLRALRDQGLHGSRWNLATLRVA